MHIVLELKVQKTLICIDICIEFCNILFKNIYDNNHFTVYMRVNFFMFYQRA